MTAKAVARAEALGHLLGVIRGLKHLRDAGFDSRGRAFEHSLDDVFQALERYEQQRDAFVSELFEDTE